jgi:hypothetical protein
MPATKRRSPVLAALASLTMPGLGQLYNGQVALALLWFVGYWAVAVLYTLKVIALMTSPDPAAHLSSPLGLLLVMGVVWLGGVVQAIFAALDRPDYQLQSYNRGLIYAGGYLLAYVVLPIAMVIPLAGGTARLKGGASTDSNGVAALLEGLTHPRAGQVGQPIDLKIDIPDPDAAAATATTVFHVTLVGGPDGGIYDATSSEPVCTYRADSTAPSWAGLYANPKDTAGLTAVQFRIPIAQGETSDFQLSVNRGNGTESRSYLVDGRRPWGEDGKGRASVERRGEGALIRVEATTEQGVRVEAVVQCRRVAVE